MKNSWHYIVFLMVTALAIYIYSGLNELVAFVQQSATRHDGKQDTVVIIFMLLCLTGGIATVIMLWNKKFVLALAALFLASIAFYGYRVLDKIECTVCARA
jgi:predicted ABC-type exoprotein transport system permease subunit